MAAALTITVHDCRASSMQICKSFCKLKGPAECVGVTVCACAPRNHGLCDLVCQRATLGELKDERPAATASATATAADSAEGFETNYVPVV
jgi:hypothetical protein